MVCIYLNPSFGDRGATLDHHFLIDLLWSFISIHWHLFRWVYFSVCPICTFPVVWHFSKVLALESPWPHGTSQLWFAISHIVVPVLCRRDYICNTVPSDCLPRPLIFCGTRDWPIIVSKSDRGNLWFPTANFFYISKPAFKTGRTWLVCKFLVLFPFFYFRIFLFDILLQLTIGG